MKDNEEIDYEGLALTALRMARDTTSPHMAMRWLEVATAWRVTAQYAPTPMPDAPDGFCRLTPVSDEITRVIFRIAATGACVVVCDPKHKDVLAFQAKSPAEACGHAMKMLDIVDRARAKDASDQSKGS